MLKWLIKLLLGTRDPTVLVVHMNVKIDGKIDHIIPTGTPRTEPNQLGKDQFVTGMSVSEFDIAQSLTKVIEPVVPFGEDQR